MALSKILILYYRSNTNNSPDGNLYWQPGQYIPCGSSSMAPLPLGSGIGNNVSPREPSLLHVVQQLQSSFDMHLGKVNNSLDSMATRFDTIEENHESLKNEVKALRTTFSTPTSSGSESGGRKRNRLTPIALQVNDYYYSKSEH